MKLSLSLNELNATETINQTSSITAALVNITTPTQEPIYAEDISLAVEIVSTLNKYGLVDDQELIISSYNPLLTHY